MDNRQVYAKTPSGDEAVRQSTRVVQRNLRMVLVQVDGKLTVAELAEKLGNTRLVEHALSELEHGGYIVPVAEAARVWEESKRESRKSVQVSALSQFSTFGPRSVAGEQARGPISQASNFSSFGKPVLPAARSAPAESAVAQDTGHDELTGGETKRHGGVLAAAVGVILLLGGIFFFPASYYKPGVEQRLEHWLGAPVQVGEMAVSWLPRPIVRLHDVRIGAAGQAQVREIRADAPLALLRDGPGLPDMVISGARLPADQLALAPLSTARSGAPGRVRVEQLEVVAGDLALRDLEGELRFSADGRLQSAAFETLDRTLKLNLSPGAPGQGLELRLAGTAWQPRGAGWLFETMTASAVLQPGRLSVRDLEAAFLGGRLYGQGIIDWRQGIAMAGEARLNGVDLSRAAAIFVPAVHVEGRLDGELRWQAAGGQVAAALEQLSGTLSGGVAQGSWQALDLAEAVRRGPGAFLRSGTTRFERLTFGARFGSARIDLDTLGMEAPGVSATGSLTGTSGGELAGRFLVTSGSQRQPVTLSGTLASPLAAVGR